MSDPNFWKRFQALYQQLLQVLTSLLDGNNERIREPDFPESVQAAITWLQGGVPPLGTQTLTGINFGPLGYQQVILHAIHPNNGTYAVLVKKADGEKTLFFNLPLNPMTPSTPAKTHVLDKHVHGLFYPEGSDTPAFYVRRRVPDSRDLRFSLIWGYFRVTWHHVSGHGSNPLSLLHLFTDSDGTQHVVQITLTRSGETELLVTSRGSGDIREKTSLDIRLAGRSPRIIKNPSNPMRWGVLTQQDDEWIFLHFNGSTQQGGSTSFKCKVLTRSDDNPAYLGEEAGVPVLFLSLQRSMLSVLKGGPRRRVIKVRLPLDPESSPVVETLDHAVLIRGHVWQIRPDEEGAHNLYEDGVLRAKKVPEDLELIDVCQVFSRQRLDDVCYLIGKITASKMGDVSKLVYGLTNNNGADLIIVAEFPLNDFMHPEEQRLLPTAGGIVVPSARHEHPHEIALILLDSRSTRRFVRVPCKNGNTFRDAVVQRDKYGVPETMLYRLVHNGASVQVLTFKL